MWNKTDRSFKTLINKRTTDSDGKRFYNEKGDSTINFHVDELWIDPVPGTPPVADTTEVKLEDIDLVEDTSVPGKHSWLATTAPATTPSEIDAARDNEAARLQDWISDKYDGIGVLSQNGYTVKLYDAANNLISPSDPSDWFFDYPTGILTFNGTSTLFGTVAGSGPYRIVGYRYIGRFGDELGEGVGVVAGTPNKIAMFTAVDAVGDSILEQIDTDTIRMVGHFEATTKQFVMDHPLHKGYELVYGCLEGPENGAYHRGIETGQGRVRVNLPRYWHKLVGMNYSILLTARGPYSVYIDGQDEDGFWVKRTGILGYFLPFCFDYLCAGGRRGAPLEITRRKRT